MTTNIKISQVNILYSYRYSKVALIITTRCYRQFSLCENNQGWIDLAVHIPQRSNQTTRRSGSSCWSLDVYKILGQKMLCGQLMPIWMFQIVLPPPFLFFFFLENAVLNQVYHGSICISLPSSFAPIPSPSQHEFWFWILTQRIG